MNKKKICLVVSSLGKGGAERSTASLSIMLSNLGYEVHIITILNHINYQYNGTLFNLGALKDIDDSKLGRFKRFLKFRNYIRSNNFDLIIDHRTRSPLFRELMILFFVYTRQIVYVIHNYKIDSYFPKYEWVKKYIANRVLKIVTVSKAIEERLKTDIGIKNTKTIYNAVDVSNINNQYNAGLGEYILSYGRLVDKVKNISLLIKAYAKSELPNKNIKLLILGDGEDKNKLEQLSMDLNMHDKIVFKGYTSNPFQYVANSKFAVLTSRHEGFPMVIPEVLSFGIPFVSVDCKSGPNEIIKHKFNGMLVENNNEKALVEAFNEMILNESLYLYCKSNAKDSIKHLSYEAIQAEWKDLIEQL